MNYYVNKITGEIIIVLENLMDYKKFSLYREHLSKRKRNAHQTYENLVQTCQLLDEAMNKEFSINNEEELLYLKELDNKPPEIIKKKELAEKWECLNNFLQNHQRV